jgi:aspartyl-tRNA(Asn)/glutamyl-tRNA(Gln) amidotransferase subunit A
MVDVFRHVDILATPTTTIAAVPLTEASVAIRGEIKSVHLSLLHNTEPCNMAGLPALSVPCGFNSNGVPIGLQLIGRPFDEAGVLRAGHAYEQATKWHLQRPPIAVN